MAELQRSASCSGYGMAAWNSTAFLNTTNLTPLKSSPQNIHIGGKPFLLGLIWVCAAPLGQAANMTPVTVSGFNRDVVVENTTPGALPYTTALNVNPGETRA